ncbi:rhodanese-like domain-containing protein [Pseudarthrobacter sp. RMG13]|uniref:Rhodanese-like domain-containing protein n=1 Tax=Pseudarthrobacter humi TaxID=2952523 RepID=A0ABT1LN08_9MICC|nr:rhodanese-like domain-containing protein [Pseudarthrobacter humi]MCP8999829.1 rhodanese-like domain-containing protein [Pseudarthrobacter humi]
MPTRRGGFVLVDSRRRESWDHGHVPGALHLPTADVERRARQLIPLDRKIVVYSWGPGCNGSTRAALAFAGSGGLHRRWSGACAGLSHRAGRRSGRLFSWNLSSFLPWRQLHRGSRGRGNHAIPR